MEKKYIDPTFQFQPCTERIQWKHILSSNVNEIFLKGNIEKLDRFLPSVTHGNIALEKDLQRDSRLEKAFKVNQLSNQYLDHCNKFLQGRCTEYLAQKEELTKQLKQCEKRVDRQKNTIEELKRKSTQLSHLINHYEELTDPPPPSKEILLPSSSTQSKKEPLVVVVTQPQEKASILIQAQVRRRLARHIITKKRRRKAEQEKENNAAQKIQNGFQRYLIKKHAGPKILSHETECALDSSEKRMHDLYGLITGMLKRTSDETTDMRIIFNTFADSKHEFLNRATFRMGLKCSGISTTREEIRQLLKFLRDKLSAPVSSALVLTYEEFRTVFHLNDKP